MQLQSFNMRKLRDTNTHRMKRLPAFGQYNTTAGVCVCVCFSLCMFYDSGDAQLISIMCLGGCSDDDDEASRGDEHFALQSPGRPSSIDTATTEPWIRAESSDTLRRLMSASEL